MVVLLTFDICQGSGFTRCGRGYKCMVQLLMDVMELGGGFSLMILNLLCQSACNAETITYSLQCSYLDFEGTWNLGEGRL